MLLLLGSTVLLACTACTRRALEVSMSGTGGTGDAGGSDGVGGTGGIAAVGCDGLDGGYVINGTLTLTLAEAGAACIAKVAPRWWPAVAFDATVEPMQLVLEATGQGATTGYYSTDGFQQWEYTRFVIPRAADGSLTAPVHIQGESRLIAGDLGKRKGVDDPDGVITLDADPPTLRARRRWLAAPVGADDWFGYVAPRWAGLPAQLLPWDTVQVEASEQVAGLAGAVSVVSANETVLVDTWDVGQFGAGSTDGVWVWGGFDDWLAVGGTSVHLAVETGLADASGNPAGAEPVAVEVLDVGTPAAVHELEDLAAICTWGDVQPAPQDPGVARLVSECYNGSVNAGIAAMVHASGAKQVSVRLRGKGQYSIRWVGSSGQEYGDIDSAPKDWVVRSFPIGSEQLMGASVSTWRGDCDMFGDAMLEVDWIRAE